MTLVVYNCIKCIKHFVLYAFLGVLVVAVAPVHIPNAWVWITLLGLVMVAIEMLIARPAETPYRCLKKTNFREITAALQHLGYKDSELGPDHIIYFRHCGFLKWEIARLEIKHNHIELEIPESQFAHFDNWCVSRIDAQ